MLETIFGFWTKIQFLVNPDDGILIELHKYKINVIYNLIRTIKSGCWKNKWTVLTTIQKKPTIFGDTLFVGKYFHNEPFGHHQSHEPLYIKPPCR